MARIVLALLVACLGLLSAQEATLSGRVLGPDGHPLDGVLVRLLGADLTAVTGSDGRWSIAEGTANAVFPGRVSSTSTITWAGPGSNLLVATNATTAITVLMFNAAGTQVNKQHFTCPGSGSFALTVPGTTALVGIATQACDRVVYAVSGGTATLTFSTCAGAIASTTAGTTKDILSYELPGYQPSRRTLTSLVGQSIPDTTLAAGTTTVNANPATLATVLAGLSGGETVLLADGSYGVFSQPGATGYSWWVRLKAAAGATPVFTSLSFESATTNPDGDNDMWLTFEGVTVTDGVSVRGARWIELRSCTVTRLGAITGSFDNVEKAGVGIRQSRGIRVEGCDVSHAGNGISGTGNHLIFRNNHVHHCSQDGLKFVGGHDFLCEYNHVHDLDDGVYDAEAATKPWNMHSDCLQMYPLYDTAEPEDWLADCTLRGNRFHRPETLGWMIQSKNQNQLKRFLIENNITTAVPGYLFHFKDSCDGVVYRFNSSVIPPSGYQFIGLSGRSFDTNDGIPYVALPSYTSQTTFVEVYGNILGVRNDFLGAALTRSDNNLYYGANAGWHPGAGELLIAASPFVDPAALAATPAAGSPAIAATLVLPTSPGPRHQVPLPAYDANGHRRAATTCLGAVDVNATPPQHAPELVVERQGRVITDGCDDTVHGAVTGAQLTVTYVITNPGTAALEIGTVTSSSPSRCVVAITQPATTVAAGSSVNLVVDVTPSPAGAWSFQLAFASNDADESRMGWTVSGTSSATTAPEIAVRRNGTELTSGSAAMAIGGTTVAADLDVDFEVANLGNAALSILSTTPTSTATCTLSVVGTAPTSVPAGETRVLTMRVRPLSAAWTASFRLTSNDTSEATFTVNLSGTAVTLAPKIVVRQGFSSIAQNATAIVSGGTAGSSSSYAFALLNSGSQSLSISSVILSGQNNCIASLELLPFSSIPLGSESALGIRVEPASNADWSVLVTVANNDSTRNPCIFTVSGTASSGGGGGGGTSGGGGGGCGAGAMVAGLILVLGMRMLRRRQS